MTSRPTQQADTMILRFVFSICAMIMVIVVLASHMRQSTAPLATGGVAVSETELPTMAPSTPVVVPVESLHASAPTTLDNGDHDRLDLSSGEVKPVQHLLPVRVSEKSQRQANSSVASDNSGPAFPSSEAVGLDTTLDSIVFDDDLTDSQHTLSKTPDRLDTAVMFATQRTAKPLVVAAEAIPQQVSDESGEKSEAKDAASKTPADKSQVANLPTTEEPPVEVEEPQLSPRMAALKDQLERVLDHYQPLMVNTRDKGHWAIMHSLIAFGVDKEIRLNGPRGRKVNAIGWIAWNGVCRGERLFYLQNGKIQSRTGPGLQGHHGQFLAMLAQSRVKANYPMKISGKDFTIADLIRREQETCVPRSELTFKLIGLAHYLDSEEQWKDEHGRDWSISRMVKEELAQPVIGAACGGTHRLFGLTYAVQKRAKQGHPVDGQFKRAEQFLTEYRQYTFRLQNKDGSFSTQFFAARGSDSSVTRRLETSGHIAEWLTQLSTDEQLEEDQMVKGIEHLARILYEGRNREWKVGPLGHGLHALNMYHQRVFGGIVENSMQVASDREEVRTAAKPKKSDS